MKASCVIVAAGRGARLGSRIPKAFVRVNGLPLVEYSLRAFQRSPAVSEIVLVAPARHAARNAPLFAKYPKLLAVVPGGAERQDSVRNGLAACDPGADVVLIHDAARPLLALRDIAAVAAAASRHGAAVLAAPVTDTIKLAGAHAIVKTIDRAHLWRAQTPQGFTPAVLLRSHAGRRGAPATDDSQLAERAGVRVRIVPASNENIKITTPHDLEVAAWLLKRR